MWRRLIVVNFPNIRWYSTEKQQEIVKTLYHDRTRWQNFESFLIDQQNFSKESFVQIVAGCPRLFTMSTGQLGMNLEAWRECQFGEERVLELVTKHPELMLYGDNRRMREWMSFLQGYVTTPYNVWKLLMNSPHLAISPRKEIEEKMDYLIKDMRIEVHELTRAEVFNHTLQHIKTRHIFLERLGMFKVLTDKAKENNEKNTNPKLYQIVDVGDKTFATKICGVTVAEYDTFIDLLKREWAREGVDVEHDEFDELQKERGIDQV